MTKEAMKVLFQDVLKNGVTVNNYAEIEKAISDLNSEIRKTANKNNGKIDQAKAAEQVIKAAKKTNNRSLFGAWIAKDGFQYVCDSHMLIRFEKPIELEQIPEGSKAVEIEKCYGIPSGDELEIPDLSELNTSIKEKKAEAKIKKIKNPRIACVLNNGMIVNAEFLKLAVMATGAKKAETPTKHNINGVIISPLYVHGNGADSMILPVNRTEPAKEKYFIF